MLIHTADFAQSVRDFGRLGKAQLSRLDWPAVRNRIFGRIDPLNEASITCSLCDGVPYLSMGGPIAVTGLGIERMVHRLEMTASGSPNGQPLMANRSWRRALALLLPGQGE